MESASGALTIAAREELISAPKLTLPEIVSISFLALMFSQKVLSVR